VSSKTPVSSVYAPFVIAVLAALISVPAAALEPKRPGQESSLTRAFFSEGRLWLLSDAGEISSIAEGKNTRVEERLPEPALDLCLQNGRPVAITCQRDQCRNWTVRQRIKGEWSIEDTIKTQGDDLIGLSCTAEKVTLLTSRRLIDSAKGRQTSVVLSDELSLKQLVIMVDTPNRVFLGFNEGEWGGGLWQIDRNSGNVASIERNASGQLCGGPLNSVCDPVNGIVIEPWKPDCIAVTVGLVHFTPHGRIVEVCGDDVRKLYYKPYEKQQFGGSKRGGEEPFETVAFFGLTSEGGQLWAAGIDGIYRINSSGVTQFGPLPKFERIGGVDVSFDLQNFVVVLTSIAARHSVSSAMPIIVPR
jgi:hypothetical protein